MLTIINMLLLAASYLMIYSMLIEFGLALFNMGAWTSYTIFFKERHRLY